MTFANSSEKRLLVMPWSESSWRTLCEPSEKMASIKCSTERYSSCSFSAVFSARFRILPTSGEAYTSPLPPEMRGRLRINVSSSESKPSQSTPILPNSDPISPPS